MYYIYFFQTYRLEKRQLCIIQGLKTFSTFSLEVKGSDKGLQYGFYVFQYMDDDILHYFLGLYEKDRKDFFSPGINVALVPVTSAESMLHNKLI